MTTKPIAAGKSSFQLQPHLYLSLQRLEREPGSAGSPAVFSG